MKEVISLGKLKTEVQNMEFSKIIGIEQMFSGYNCMQRLVKDLIQAYLFVQSKEKQSILTNRQKVHTSILIERKRHALAVLRTDMKI